MLLQKPVLRKKDTHLAVRFECFQQYTDMTQQSRVWAPMKTASAKQAISKTLHWLKLWANFALPFQHQLLILVHFYCLSDIILLKQEENCCISKNSTLSTVTGKLSFYFQQLEKVTFNNSNPYLKPYHHTWNVALLYAEHHRPYGKIQVQPL